MTRRSAEERAELTREFELSGKSQAEFCREKGLNVQTFSGWLKSGLKQAQKVGESKFVTLCAVPAKVEPRRVILEVTFSDGTVARVSGNA